MPFRAAVARSASRRGHVATAERGKAARPSIKERGKRAPPPAAARLRRRPPRLPPPRQPHIVHCCRRPVQRSLSTPEDDTALTERGVKQEHPPRIPASSATRKRNGTAAEHINLGARKASITQLLTAA
ncbi:hypothetical protein MRX96_007471 [Rhipicephalus microplus]